MHLQSCRSNPTNIWANQIMKACFEKKLMISKTLLLSLKKVASARLRARDVHPISQKTPATQYQPIDRKKRKRKRVEDYSRDRAAEANKEVLALLLKTASPTPSITGLARSFQKDTENGIKVLLYCKGFRCISSPMCDQSTACNPHWHIRSGRAPLRGCTGLHRIL